jgi:8-oxo-dGTP pyrophosphatase MutT (NUDIX family)
MSSAREPVGSPDNPIPRRGARVLLVDGAGRVLMFRGRDPGRPGIHYWFTVGGGLDQGETPDAGALRELREETGLVIERADLAGPVWRQVTDFPYDGRWYRQEQDFFVVRVGSWEVSTVGFDDEELSSIDAHRWWSVPELETTAERFYPAELPDLVRGILGE